MKNKITKFGILFLIVATSLFFTPIQEKANAQWTPTSGVSGGFIWRIISSGSNLYVGTFGYGVFKSTDNGTSWNPCVNGLKNYYIFSLASSGPNIIAGTAFGIYYSSNNGDNWIVADTVLTANKIVYAISTLGTAGTLFAGTSYHNTSDPKTTFTSTNNGVTWATTTTNPQSGGTNLGIYSLVEYGGNLYAGTAGASVFRTVNYGGTWTQMTGGTMGLTQNVYCLGTITTGTNRIIAGTYQNGFFWSTDGSTWTPQNSGLPAAPNNTIYNVTTIGSNIFVPSYGNLIYMATNGTSLSWTATTSTGLFNKFVYSIYSIGSTLYAGTWGAGVFISNNNSSSWTRSNSGIKDVVMGCLAVNGTTLFAGTVGNGVFYSTNNGDSWTQADNTGLGEPSILTIMPFSTNIYAGTNDGIYLSGNNGVTWTSSSSGIPAATQINCLISVGTNMFAGAQNNHVYKSTNNGATWTDIGSPGSGPVTSFNSIGVNIFLGCIGGGVWYSLNGGTSWIHSLTGMTNLNVHSLSIMGTTNIFAGTERGVFLSTNTGASWTRVSNRTNGMDSVLTVNSIVNDGTNVIAGTFNGVYLTSDMGATWQKKNQGLGADTLFTCLLINNGSVIAGMWPMVPNNSTVSPLVWKRSIANISIGIKNISSGVPDKFSLMQNYPNPFNPTTTIKWSITERAFVTLKIFDSKGQEIGTFVNDSYSPGVYEANIDASNLASGVYFYRLQAGKYMDTKKMILIK